MNGLAARGAYLVSDPQSGARTFTIRSDVANDDLCSLAGKQQSFAAAYPATRTGDYCSLAEQALLG
jgi:hypothetical protein